MTTNDYGELIQTKKQTKKMYAAGIDYISAKQEKSRNQKIQYTDHDTKNMEGVINQKTNNRLKKAIGSFICKALRYRTYKQGNTETGNQRQNLKDLSSFHFKSEFN